jgi:hypothetical protein
MRLDHVSLAALAAIAVTADVAHADDLVLSGPVDRVVAAGSLVAAVRAGEVRVLDLTGRTVWRLGGGDSALPRPARRLDLRVADLLDERDIAEEERESTEAEDLVEDDLTGHERRADATPVLDGAPRRVLLASDGYDLWVAARGLMIRIDASARVSTRPAILPFTHLAVTGGKIVAADATRLFSSDDGGATLRPLAEAGARITALVAAPDRVAYASGRQIAVREAGEPERRLALTAPVVDLRACGRVIAALTAEGGVVALDADHAAVRGHLATRAAHLACDGDLWVAAGPGLATSRDGGRSWRARLDAPLEPIHDVALGDSCLWLATAAGLRCLPRDGGARRRTPVIVETILPRPAPWHALLPRLVLTGILDSRPGKQDLRAMAYADFPLDRGGRPRPVPVAFRLAAEEHVPTATGAPPDPEAPCLVEVRDRGVALAMAEARAGRSLVSRARQAAWLPDLRLRVVRRLGRTESLSLRDESATVAPLGLGTVDDVRYEARASWDLSRLVFNIDEVAARSQAQRMADMRREIESSANRLYFERRRLKTELLHGPGPEPATRAQKESRVEELESELDALSGGAFGRCIGRPTEAPP